MNEHDPIEDMDRKERLMSVYEEEMKRIEALLFHPIKHSSCIYFASKRQKRVRGYRKEVTSRKIVATRKEYCKVKKKKTYKYNRSRECPIVKCS